jgi:hypothetical protein
MNKVYKIKLSSVTYLCNIPISGNNETKLSPHFLSDLLQKPLINNVIFNVF